MNFKTTLTLLVLLAVVGLAALFFRPKGQGNPWDGPAAQLNEGAKTPLLKTLGIDSQRITRVKFAPVGKPVLELLREGDAWRMLTPVNMRVKTAEVEGLLLAPLAAAQIAGQAEGGPAPGGGFIEIQTDGRTLRLDLGADRGAGLADLAAGGRAFRVESNLHQLLAHLPPLVAFIKPTLDTWPATRVERLTVTSAKGTVAVLRKGGQWTLDRAGAPRASGEALADYCAAMAAARILELPQENASPALFGLDRPLIDIELREAAQTTRLEVGGPADPAGQTNFVRLTRPGSAPLVAVVESQAVLPLAQGEAFFRDNRVVTTKRSDVRRIRTEGFDLTLDAKGRVQFTDPKAPFAADTQLGQAAFEAVFKLKPAKAGAALLGKTVRTVTLTDVFGREEKLELSEAGGDYAVAHPGEAEGFVVPKAQVEALLAAAEGLRDREIKWLPEGSEIAEITLNQAFCGAKFAFVKKDGKWTESGGKAFELAAVEELEKALRQPRIERFVKMEAGANPIQGIMLTAKSNAPGGEGVLNLGVIPDEAGSLTWSSGPREITHAFMPQKLTALLQSEFHPRQLISLAPHRIASIEIIHGENKATARIIRRADGVFEAAGATLNQAACAALFDAFGNLRAEQPFEVFGDRPDDTFVTLNAAGDRKDNGYTVVVRKHQAWFSSFAYGRFFVWDPASPQAKALQTVLDKMK